MIDVRVNRPMESEACFNARIKPMPRGLTFLFLEREMDNVRTAVCVLTPSCRGGHDGRKGGVVVMQEMMEGGRVVGLRLNGTVHGLTPGLHGFHVHTSGDLRLGCASLCAHFNPTNSQHGGPRSTVRHLGDLGNIFADVEGVAKVHIEDAFLRLSGPNSVIGRSLVVHADRDDLGRGPGPDSAITGNSGARILGGVIGWASDCS